MTTPRTLPLKTASQLGQMLRAARKARKLTQAEVASRIGLSQNRLSHLELHPEELSFRQLLAWASTLGLELCLGERGQDPIAPGASEW
jgi:HTH-type transcriptional regulator/antitoxin HipB